MVVVAVMVVAMAWWRWRWQWSTIVYLWITHQNVYIHVTCCPPLCITPTAFLALARDP